MGQRLPPDNGAFEAQLETALHTHAQSALVQQMLADHFGFCDDQIRRGKRLRPRLVLCVAQSNGAPPECALDAAVAVELLHNYSLIHDDIEDRDELRWGRPTLWVKYGLAQALNAGDALCALSFLSLLSAARYHGAAVVTSMVEALSKAHLAMCNGQSSDIAFESHNRIGVEDYLDMIAGKTAALFAVSAELGARCANASVADVQSARNLGFAFGMAFQIMDDYSGVWGTQVDTGKAPGADIVRAKKTFPIVWAAERGVDVDQADIAGSVAALEACGAREAAWRAAAEHLRQVEEAPIGPVRDFLLAALPRLGDQIVR